MISKEYIDGFKKQYIENIFTLIDRHPLPATQIAYELGISPSTFTHLKTGRNSTRIDQLIMFSEYFNVSIDVLVKGKV